MTDYYRILEVTRNANSLEIKKAYRQLALRYHPDKNHSSDAHLKFIEITEAYEVLIDGNKRQEYDYFYDKFFRSKEVISYEEPTYKEKQAKWQDYGQQRAHDYSQMDINQFLKSVFDDAAFHGGYFSRIGCITVIFILTGILGLFILLPMMMEDKRFMEEFGPLGFLVVIGVCGVFIFLGVRGVRNEVEDYKYDPTPISGF